MRYFGVHVPPMVEPTAVNRVVVGSSPTRGASTKPYAQQKRKALNIYC